MDKVDYYFQHFQKAQRDLAAVKHLLENYKPLSEDAFLYSLATKSSTEERVKMSKTNSRYENMALTYREKYLDEDQEYQHWLLEKYCYLKTDLDFFTLAIQSVDEVIKDVVVDLILLGLTWDELLPKHNVSRMTVSRYRKKALKQVKEYYHFAGKSLSRDEQFD
ncbi:hypothetical protein QE611_04105 [Streptococcus suis]|uniref:hypothetical protein n=1 Tax=Streptococcus suis TaxID=1307 RepID=UPI0037578A83